MSGKATVTLHADHRDALDRVEERTQITRHRLVALILDAVLADGADALADRITAADIGWEALRVEPLDLATIGAEALGLGPMPREEVAE